MIVLAVLVFMLWAPVAHAATYFVAPPPAGNDSTGNGSEGTPWATLQKCNDTAASGDTCLVKDGTYTTSATNYLLNATKAGITWKSVNYLGAKLSGQSNHTSRGIRLTASSVTIEGFEIYGFGTTNINSEASGLTGITIRRNLIHDNGRVCTTSNFGHNGIFVGSSSANWRIEYNVIHTVGRFLTGESGCSNSASGKDHGIYVGQSNGIVIAHNILYYVKNGWAIQFHVNTQNNVDVVNNTFAESGTNRGFILFSGGPFTDVEIANNIFTAPGSVALGVNAASFTSLTTHNNLVTSSACLWTGCSTPSGVQDFDNVTNTNPNFTNAGGRDFTLTSSSTNAINTGFAVSGFAFNGSAPDKGAHESIPAPTAASASGNVVEVTLPMSMNVPVLPATGQTTWAVKFSGIARTTVSAVKKTGTDSVVQITFDGDPCENTDTMTVDYTAGTVSDSALIGGTLNQKLFSFTALAVNESACTGGGGGNPPENPTGIVYDMNNISGTTVPDIVNENDGTTTGSPTVVTGLIDDALSFADGVDDYITAPHGSGINPTTQSGTYCILVSPDSTSVARGYMGTPVGTNQRFQLVTTGGTWAFGIQGSTHAQNNEFPVATGWQFPCVEFNASTGKATLIVNAVRGTTETVPTAPGDSVKPYTSYTFAGNLRIGKAGDFVTTASPGGDIDHFVYYPNVLTQQEMTELYQSLVQPSPPPTSSTREQKGHKFQRPFKKSGAAEDLRGVDQDGRVSRGGYVDVVIQIDCTDDDCPSFAPRIHRSIDGGATYAQVNDVCGVICFRGTSTNPDLVSADVECCLTGALTEVDGPTNFTSAAVPNITLSQDHSITLRYKLKVDASATPGQEIYLKVYDQNGNELEGGYTPALGAKLTVKDYANGGGF